MFYIKVLSLFDGMSCGRIALERANINVDTYYASEIDSYAIKVTQNNYSDTIQVGSIEELTNEKVEQLGKIDLLIGGSPCVGFSLAGKQLNFEDPQSKLFFEYERILNHLKRINPNIKFLLENVKMKDWCEDVISERVGVKPIIINSSLVSAHNRVRLYWTNIEGVAIPEDRNITLPDIFDYHEQTTWEKKFQFPELLDKCDTYLKIDRKGKVKKLQDKAGCLTGGHRGDGNHSDMDLILFPNGEVRRYSPLECERLQTVPDGYTEGVSNTQRYKMLANGWTVDVVSHILSHT